MHQQHSFKCLKHNDNDGGDNDGGDNDGGGDDDDDDDISRI